TKLTVIFHLHFPVFTEQGVAMLSSVLNSERAIEINILIMRAFVQVRKLVYSYKDLADKIRKMEMKYDGKFSEIYNPAPFKHKNLCFMSTY
ncbi:hypothetical protein L6248_02730, partial [Candidatus Parcubacteria bacterium]|nr:hypothetical protein [Candidatus Parcubacteria bacterium]